MKTSTETNKTPLTTKAAIIYGTLLHIAAVNYVWDSFHTNTTQSMASIYYTKPALSVMQIFRPEEAESLQIADSTLAKSPSTWAEYDKKHKHGK